MGQNMVGLEYLKRTRIYLPTTGSSGAGMQSLAKVQSLVIAPKYLALEVVN